MLKQVPTHKGYLKVVLCKNKKKYNNTVHRLVGKAFIPNPNGYTDLNHKNEDKTDNRVENLEWCTKKYNINYVTHNERSALSRSKKVLQFDLNGNFIKEYISATEVKRQLGFDNRNISRCCNGKGKTCSGYIWRYKEEGQ